MRRPFEHPHKEAERLRQAEEEDRSNDLLSCPFCGSSEPTLYLVEAKSCDKGEAWQVICKICQNRTAKWIMKKHAVLRWNSRTR